MARPLAALVAVVAWGAVILQFWLNMTGHNTAEPDYHPNRLMAFIDFFSHFSIVSNLLCALLTAFAALAPRSKWSGFLSSPRVATSAALYIVVTGLVFFLLLRQLSSPVGAQLVARVGLHYIVPPLFILYWLVVVPKGTLRLADVGAMLVLPLIYGAYLLIRGTVTAAVDPSAVWYPYPFMSVPDLGYPRVLLNMLGVAAVFAGLGLCFVGIDRLLRPLARLQAATSKR